jgi:hypothetical protein
VVGVSRVARISSLLASTTPGLEHRNKRRPSQSGCGCDTGTPSSSNPMHTTTPKGRAQDGLSTNLGQADVQNELRGGRARGKSVRARDAILPPSVALHHTNAHSSLAQKRGPKLGNSRQQGTSSRASERKKASTTPCAVRGCVISEQQISKEAASQVRASVRFRPALVLYLCKSELWIN